MKTSTGTMHPTRGSDGERVERDFDPYQGNAEAKALGTDARMHELGVAIWTKYLEQKAKAPEGRGGIPRGNLGFMCQDILMTVPKEEWAKAGVRVEDIVLLEKSANSLLSQNMKEFFAGQIDFLNGVLAVVIALSTEYMTEEGCKTHAAELRARIGELLGKGKEAATVGDAGGAKEVAGEKDGETAVEEIPANRNPIEIARAYDKYVKNLESKGGITRSAAISSVAHGLGRSFNTVERYLKLLDLDTETQEAIMRGETPEEARHLLAEINEYRGVA